MAATMREAGYYAFGIGKFHTKPDAFEDVGYDLQLNTEELWETPELRMRDAYAGFLRAEHPEYNHLEQLHGERTNMYYMPQMSPLPAELTVESYVADRTVEQLNSLHGKPYFGFVSFVGPHPPCAPPIPYNRMYDPDAMPNPICGNKDVDLMDEQIGWMNHLIWADEMNDFLSRNLRSRYYGEITYIDSCIGRILDAVESRDDADNTLICFFADHGDHLGDHHAWQKESYFEQSCRVPFLLSWPKRYEGGISDDQLVCLTDLFGIATAAAGCQDAREGHPIIDVLDGKKKPREVLYACYGRPGTPLFKAMIRKDEYKYIFMANGGRTQLFSLSTDPNEHTLLNEQEPALITEMHKLLVNWLDRDGLRSALNGNAVRTFPYTPRPLVRIKQFDQSAGIHDFTKKR